MSLFSSVPAWLHVFVALVATLAALAYYYFTSTFGYWRDKGVEFVKPLPFVGSMYTVITMQEHMMEFFQRQYKELKDEPFTGYFQSRTPSLLIHDPELIKNVLVKDFAHFMDHGVKIHEETDPLEAKGLFNLEGQRWKDMRTKLTPTFTSGRMKGMLPLIQECADQLEEQIAKLAESGEEFEAKDLLSRYTTDVISSCAFGIKSDSLKDPNCHFFVMGKKIFEMDFWRGIKMFLIVFMPEIAVRFKIPFLSKEVTDYFRKLVRDVIDLRARTGITRKDFMQLLIELKDKGQLTTEDGDEKDETLPAPSNNLKLSHDDVTAQALVFFSGGFETSSIIMSFALLELAVNPDVQRKAQHEIQHVLQRHGGTISYQALQEMHYLDWIMQETMRKYPPVVILMRVCTKNYVIPGTNVTIEEGTPVTIPIHAMQNDPKYFPDPERFDPERFSDQQRSKQNQFVYMPFGEGPRMCIGSRFALLQTKLGLLCVLRRSLVALASRTSYPVVLDPKQFMLVPTHGVWLSLAPRRQQ